MEAVVSLLLLVIVMVVTMSLLFSMRSFAERQTSKTAPRQTSRQAIDYVSYFAGGAADLNIGGGLNNPNAVITYWRDGTGTIRQASFNNLSGSPQATYGEVGTDIVTLAVPVNPVVIRVGTWSGFNTTTQTSLNFTAGCGSTLDSNANAALFRQLTGAHPDPAAPASTISDLLLARDMTGAWGYYRITQYDPAPDCSRAGAALRVVSNPVATARIENPAGQPTLVDPVTLVAGIQFVSFRVRQNAAGVLNLEQKQGIFDPSTDNPGTAFFPIVEDIEDFQVAWLYDRAPVAGGSTIFASTTQAFPAGVTGGVPPQGGQGGPVEYDVTRVAGLRVSMVARSRPLRMTSLQLTTQATPTRLNRRPAVEDRPVGLIDGFDHQRITTTIMIRNRMLGY